MDTGEMVYISSLSLLKMLKHGWSHLKCFLVLVSSALSHIHSFIHPRTTHTTRVAFRCASAPHDLPHSPLPPPLPFACVGRAGVPMEVMGLMLGEFVDDYTVTVKDVFAMPQSGTVR
jgi:hypothetical protein